MSVSATASKLSPSQRLYSVDLVRGLVVVIMALDHTRDLLHTDSLTHDPTDLASTSPILFFTRWVTHLCAPIFVFLSGTSAYLMMHNAHAPRTATDVRRFLITRGLWLILLECTVVGFGIWCDVQFRSFLFQVIFAIGAGFILLSLFIKLNPMLIACIGAFIIITHNALPDYPFGKAGAQPEALQLVWGLFFKGGFFKLGAIRALIVGYPVVPWLGIMLLGFGFGKIFGIGAATRRRILLQAGTLAIILFVLLRYSNLYGDPNPWQAGYSPTFTFLSFLNLDKYPPSLLYTCVTLSVMFFMLYLAERLSEHPVASFLITYGRVPMFFYLCHWYIIHTAMFIMLLLQGVREFQFGIMQFGRPEEGVGIRLPYVYLAWALLIAVMYPLCRAYGRYKAAHREKKWLAYL